MRILSVLVTLSLFCLFISCGGDSEEALDASEDQTPDIATLTGEVTLEGESDHSRIEVQIYQDESLLNTSETDASGNYSIGLKKIGSYKLVFEKDGFTSFSQEVSAVEGANTIDPAILQPGGTITGIIRYEPRFPDETQLEAKIISESNGQEIVPEIDGNGRYNITVLPGIYTVIVEDSLNSKKFSPVEHQGVEVKIGDSIALETILTSWPYFEAEDATEIIKPMSIEDDAAASGGQYILAGGGKIIFEVMIPEDGDYIIWGRVSAKDGNTDSFFVGVNVDEASDLWDLPEGGNWQWFRCPTKYEMSKGQNSIVFQTREANAKLDKVFMTTSSSARPQ